jgi:hypothetical protein
VELTWVVPLVSVFIGLHDGPPYERRELHFAHFSTFAWLMVEKVLRHLRRLPFYFDARPFFKKQQGGGIVEVGVTIFNRHIVNVFDGFKPR